MVLATAEDAATYAETETATEREAEDAVTTVKAASAHNLAEQAASRVSTMVATVALAAEMQVEVKTAAMAKAAPEGVAL